MPGPGDEQTPPTSRVNPRVYLVVCIVFLYILHPTSPFDLLAALFIGENGSSASSSELYSAAGLAARNVAAAHSALELLNNSTFGDFVPAAEPRDNGDRLPRTQYLNITGFREQDGLAWDDLGRFREQSRKLSEAALWTPTAEAVDSLSVADLPAVWRNASGTLRGDWVRKDGSVPRSWENYNLSATMPWLDWIGGTAGWERNITGSDGAMTIVIKDKKDVLDLEDDAENDFDLVRGVRADLGIEDHAGTGANWDMRLHGVHWPLQGRMLLTTTSQKFLGVFGLPFLASTDRDFRSSRKLLNRTLTDIIADRESRVLLDTTLPLVNDLDSSAGSINPMAHCETVLYAQIHPPQLPPSMPGLGDSTSMVDAIEAELHSPSGAPTGKTPQYQVSAVLWSPDCAFFLESKGPPDFPPGENQHLVGVKMEVQRYRINTWIMTFAAIMLAQTYALKIQMHESSTPSTMGRISCTTIGIMVTADGTTFAVAWVWIQASSPTLLPTLALSFFAFLSTMLGGVFLAKIYEMQPTLNRPRRVGPSSRGTTPAPPPDSLPLPVTASDPVIVPSDQDIGAEIAQNASQQPRRPFNQVLVWMIFLGLTLALTALASSAWTARARNIYLDGLCFAYLSMWVPQIRRNAIRNSRRALSWTFVVAQSVLRLAPLAYFYVYPHNFLFVETNTYSFACFAGWVWLQIFAMGVQDVLGPRFCLPKSWAPEAWDYHPILREDGLEAGGLPIGLISDHGSADLDKGTSARWSRGEAGSPKQTRRGKARRGHLLREIDCTICTDAIEVPVVRAGDEEDVVSGMASVLARRQYMVTPCRHIFHSRCLEGWMRYKLQCPICREDLPPL